MNRLLLSIAVFLLASCTGAAPATAPPPTPATPSAVATVLATPTPTPIRTPAPSPSPKLLARGNFESKGATVDIEATGEGSSVQGVMTIIDQGPSFTVDLECTRSTPGGLIVIGGETIESTHDFAPKGTRVAMVVDPGSPVRAHPHFEEVPPAGTCLEFLESVTDAESADFLEPIEGSIEIGPPHP